MTKLITLLLNSLMYMFFVLPRSAHYAAAVAFGWLWFDVLRFRRALVLQNLKKAFPSWDKEKAVVTGRQSLIATGRNVLDVALIPFMDKEWLKKHVEFRGRNFYEEATKQNKGVMLLSLHLGSGDLACASMSVSGIPLHVITKEFKSAWLNNFWLLARKKHGTRFISDRKSTFEILRALKKNEAVVFVLDQFMGPPIGAKTKFFGHDTGTAMGLAVIVDRAECPVVPVFTYYEKNKLIVEFGPEIPLERRSTREDTINHMTQRYTDVIEEIVKKYPEQWMWVHRRWKEFKT